MSILIRIAQPCRSALPFTARQPILGESPLLAIGAVFPPCDRFRAGKHAIKHMVALLIDLRFRRIPMYAAGLRLHEIASFRRIVHREAADAPHQRQDGASDTHNTHTDYLEAPRPCRLPEFVYNKARPVLSGRDYFTKP